MRRLQRLLWRYQPELGHGYSPRPMFAKRCWRCGARPNENCSVVTG